jgi:hypothetical protein
MTKRRAGHLSIVKPPSPAWPPEMLVLDARASLRRVIQKIWKETGATPTRDQLLAADVPAHIIDLLFRSVLLEVVRARVNRVMCA